MAPDAGQPGLPFRRIGIVIKVSREWATPLTIGVFGVMAITGTLMFFHLDTGLNKPAHEWLGWLMVAAAAAHGLANWPGLRRHLVASRLAQVILALALLLLAGSFVPLREEGGASPPVMALQALARAPLHDVLPLTGKDLPQAQAALAAAGFGPVDGAQTLQQLSGGNRQKLGLAVRTLLAPAP